MEALCKNKDKSSIMLFFLNEDTATETCILGDYETKSLQYTEAIT